MTDQNRQAKFIAAALFVSLFLLWGSCYNTFGVFFTPLLKDFHGTHASISLCATAIVLFTGAAAPLAGWLMKSVDVRLVMVSGATLAGVSLIGISRSTGFTGLLVWYVLLGVGLGGSTMVPASLVITNWFKHRRGTVLGVATAGMELGGVIMTLLSAHLIATVGWRTAYLVLAAPIFVIVLPLIILVVRTRPEADAPVMGVETPLPPEDGLKVGEAFRNRSFWMLGLAQFCFGVGVAGALIHMVPMMLKVGYTAATGALALSSVHAFITVGKPTMGVLGDHIGARKALAGALAICALGTVLMGDAPQGAVLAAGIALYAFMLATPIALIPVILLDVAGPKSLGPLFGLLFFTQTAGAAIGPIIVGRIFDVTGGYMVGYAFSAAILFAAALSVLGCVQTYTAAPARVALASD